MNKYRHLLFFVISSLTVYSALMQAGLSIKAEPVQPQLERSFVLLPQTAPEIRFAFSCEDDLEISGRLIAEHVEDAGTANVELVRVKMVTKRPLNIITFSSLAEDWSPGLYRLEIIHQNKVIHIESYLIEEVNNDF
ncbi:MAG: hypothetical protein P8K79_01095 [Mariniblastus sp.]|nr:hypothetical protein [Mariniblastus sp.]